MSAAQSFREKFPGMRAGLNWGRFEAERWTTEEFEVSQTALVGQFHSFFRTSFGRINRRGFLHGIARTLRVSEVMSRLDHIPERNRNGIEYFAQKFGSSSSPVRIDVPAYNLGLRGLYLMDCNHRVCGVLLASVPFVLTVHTVKGPVERAALSDLAFCR